MMKTIEIKAEPKEKAAIPESLVRQMYDLLGGNMTEIVGESSRDWQSDAQFSRWKNRVFLGDVQSNTSHLLLVDQKGLRGFLSYTARPDTTEIYLNEVQIRPSCRADGVTLRRLIRRFAHWAEQMPHDTLRTYSNAANTNANALAAKAGFVNDGKTDRGNQYRIPKRVFLAKFRRGEWQNNRVQATR